ncbi:MAG: hypothetical protein QNJ63_09405 [Calothrix sp. MO_192.B10]|nr:hypothetical protein [Calothrix sp. MO_192.B10]
MFIKAISAKSPGFFQSELKRKAENAGGKFTTFATQTTALSQTHLDGTRIKKKLSQRVHYDVTGVVMHRDLFSAYLSRWVYGDVLSLRDAQWEYPDAEPYLMDGWKRYQQTANRVGNSESGNNHMSLERLSIEVLTPNQIASKGEKLG